MTDNEKRAHDIALEITSIAHRLLLESLVHNGKIGIHIDTDEFVSDYKAEYANILNLLNEN